MVNLQSNIAKLRYWQEYTRLFLVNEVYMRTRMQKLLSRQYNAVAEDPQSVDARVDSFKGELRNIIEESIIRIATLYRPYAMQKIEDGTKSIEIKYDSQFWHSIREFAKNHAAERVTNIQSTTKKMLKRIIENALEDGLGYVGARKNIKDLAEIETEYRAAMIASTEIHSYTGESIDETMRVDGDMQEKEWLGAADERERPTHVDANGQRVEMDEPFLVGDDELQYPGDPAGSAKEIIRCRCAALYYS